MNLIKGLLQPSKIASAHCDGPCGVYDPASARIAAEAVLSMAKKLVALEGNDLATENTRSRYITIKEEQAQVAKTELLILWTDYIIFSGTRQNCVLRTRWKLVLMLHRLWLIRANKYTIFSGLRRVVKM
jgi:nickel-type superoxide dismutase